MALGLCNAHLLRKADSLFSEYIRKRDGHCMVCGSRDRLQCAHKVSRRYRSVRWKEDNAVCLCASCHYLFENRPLEWQDWVGGWPERRREALDWSGDWKDLAVNCIERLGDGNG